MDEAKTGDATRGVGGRGVPSPPKSIAESSGGPESNELTERRRTSCESCGNGSGLIMERNRISSDAIDDAVGVSVAEPYAVEGLYERKELRGEPYGSLVLRFNGSLKL